MKIFSRMMKGLAACSAAAFMVAAGTAQAQAQAPAQGGAQAYPTRSVKIVVPYAAGGSTDILARLLAQKMNESWGQTVLVDNRTGASGIIGTDAVAKAAPDGYTLLVGITSMVQFHSLYNKLPFDAYKDFAPVSQLALSSNLFLVPVATPANTMAEFVKLVKDNPKKYNIGSFGNATTSHINAEMLKAQAGIDLVHIPYRGGAPLLSDLMGGQIASGFVDVGVVRGHLKSGKFKVLAVTGAQRLKLLPDVPTMTELGYKSFEPYGFWGIYVPAGTPKDVVNKLSKEIQRIVRLPEVAARIEDLGLQAVGGTPEELNAVLKSDTAVWARVIKEANIKIE
jgi:tripartite-type tricarboxylate transporter receptor subunit TctC